MRAVSMGRESDLVRMRIRAIMLSGPGDGTVLD